FGHFKSPLGRRFDLIIRARRLECGVYDALTLLGYKNGDAFDAYQDLERTEAKALTNLFKDKKE
ncbi:hypothetical protein ACSTE1_21220, partial [Vibrio vulnificus]